VIESRWTTAGGLRMHARVSTNPPASDEDLAVVLVHGLVVSSLYHLPTAERLAPFYRILAPDLPGFGRSEKPARALDVGGLADALEMWMEANGLGRVVLVGNSLGCQVVANLAARGRHDVAGVVLSGPTVDAAGRNVPEQLKRLMIDFTRERFSLLFVQLRSLLQAGLSRAWRTAMYALEDRIEEQLPHVSSPALVVRGSLDPLAPQGWAERVARTLPRGRLVVVPGAPHALNYSTPDEFALVVREFIGREVSDGGAFGRAS